MNKPSVLLCTLSAAMVGLPTAAIAYDDDPGNGYSRSWFGGRHDYGDTRLPSKPVYYVPTQRYYGAGYTVSYRYLPVFRYGGLPTYSSNFRTEAYHIEPEEVLAWGSRSPRLTLKEKTSVRPPVTSINRKKSASGTPVKPTGAASLAATSHVPPPITPAAVPVSQASALAPVPATSAPAPIPPPSDSLVKP